MLYVTYHKISRMLFPVCNLDFSLSKISGLEIYKKSSHYPFHPGYRLAGILAYIKGSYKIPHNEAFYQDLHCLLR